MYRQESLRQAPQDPTGRAAVGQGKVMMNLAWSLKLFADPYFIPLLLPSTHIPLACYAALPKAFVIRAARNSLCLAVSPLVRRMR